jgi:hypothetical protein
MKQSNHFHIIKFNALTSFGQKNCKIQSLPSIRRWYRKISSLVPENIEGTSEPFVIPLG